MKLLRSISSLIALILLTTILTSCSQPSTSEKKIIKEKVMTLSIGEKIVNNATNVSMVFNGFPNEKTLAFTTRERYLYTSLFYSTDHPQPLPVPILRMTITLLKVDYQKGTIVVKLKPIPVSKKTK